MSDFADMIATDRSRLTGELYELDTKRDAVLAELRAIAAYETVKMGKAATRQPGTGRGRKDSKRTAILDVIGSSDGMTRGDILETMSLKGDKTGEMSVSNALTALTKSGQMVRDGKRYKVAA